MIPLRFLKCTIKSINGTDIPQVLGLVWGELEYIGNFSIPLVTMGDEKVPSCCSCISEVINGPLAGVVFRGDPGAVMPRGVKSSGFPAD